MSATSHASTPTPVDRETAEALRTLARRLEHELLAALEAASPRHAVDRLPALTERLDELDTVLNELAPDVTGPLLARLRLGLDRLACDLHQRGGWEHLEKAQHDVLLARHAAGLTRINGIGPASAEVLFKRGISDPERFFHLGPEALDDIDGLNAAVVARLKQMLKTDKS